MDRIIGILLFIFFISIIILIWNSQSNVEAPVQVGFDKQLKTIQAAWNNKGYALYKEGNYEEAIKCYDKAIELDPNYSLAWGNKGEALKQISRTAESNAAFAKAKELGYNG